MYSTCSSCSLLIKIDLQKSSAYSSQIGASFFDFLRMNSWRQTKLKLEKKLLHWNLEMAPEHCLVLRGLCLLGSDLKLPSSCALGSWAVHPTIQWPHELVYRSRPSFLPARFHTWPCILWTTSLW